MAKWMIYEDMPLKIKLWRHWQNQYPNYIYFLIGLVSTIWCRLYWGHPTPLIWLILKVFLWPCWLIGKYILPWIGQFFMWRV